MLATAAVKVPLTVLHNLASNPSPCSSTGTLVMSENILVITTVGGATGIQEVEARVLHSAQDSSPKEGGSGPKHQQCQGRGTRRQACLQVPWSCEATAAPNSQTGRPRRLRDAESLAQGHTGSGVGRLV